MRLSVIEFQDPTRGEIMVTRIPFEGTGEFIMGSQLIVQDGQIAVFYRDGKAADVFKSGRYTLDTQNLPILTKLLSLATFRGGKSPFRAYVYFVQLKTFTNLGWGTATPVLFRDAEFKAVHLRANGTFSLRIEDPEAFLRTIVGSQGRETTYAVQEFIRRIIVSRFASLLPTILKTVLDLPVHYREIEAGLKEEVHDDLAQYGLELVDLLVEAITVPPEVQQMINRAAGSRALDDSDLARYRTMAASDAMRDASKQPGGGLGNAVGLGAGMGIARQMADVIGGSQQAGPPPLPGNVQWYAAIGGQQVGPFTQEQLRTQIQTGQVKRDTLVWRQGMANWTAAEQIEALAQIFGDMPPPLPET